MKKNNQDKNLAGQVKIKKSKSGLSEFIKRPLPTEKEVEEFEEMVAATDDFAPISEDDEEEIEDSLSEIYQDDSGKVVDVKKLNIIKKRGFLFWLLNSIFMLAVMAALVYGVYYYIFQGGSDSSMVRILITGEEKVMAGEEFFYTIDYKNSSNVDLNNVFVEVSYPDNFIFLDSSPQRSDIEEIIEQVDDDEANHRLTNSSWYFEKIKSGGSASLKIKGKIIGPKGDKSILLAKAIYTPENFSSEFKKEASFETEINDIGLDLSPNYSSSVLVNEENEIVVKIKMQQDNFFNKFRLAVGPLDNLDIIAVEPDLKDGQPEEEGLRVKKIRSGIWEISGVAEDEQILKIKYKITEKLEEDQELVWRFEQEGEDGESYTFFEEKIGLEVMKNDLNLTLIINGSKNDQGVDFGQTLNYSVVYNNKGEVEMKDVVVMAVLGGDVLDWDSLDDKQDGQVRGNTISWTKEEIPALANLKRGQEGVIDFSIKILSFESNDLGKDFSVKSYIQFSIGDLSGPGQDENTDNRSNKIINKINSDLSLKEEIRYFNNDNIPVGNGPLPPKVGETTSFKIYWTLTNNLHELSDAQVEVNLPAYVSWDNKNRTSVGSLKYDELNHQVIWQIGRLPVSVYRADAEFNIGITPTNNDRNKILVLLPGSKAQAKDITTQSIIISQTKGKTTKLEDDEIAGLSNDGRVE